MFFQEEESFKVYDSPKSSIPSLSVLGPHHGARCPIFVLRKQLFVLTELKPRGF